MPRVRQRLGGHFEAQTVHSNLPIASPKLSNWLTSELQHPGIRAPGTYWFLTRHALPLRERKTWCPRKSRGGHAEFPRNISRSWTRHRPVHGLDSAAHRTRTQIVRVREQSTGMDTNNPRPQCGSVISCVMSPGTRLRHFPRESLIARLSSGEASIVKVELAGQRGGLTLTTRSEPDNRRAIHAEPEVNPARMRTGHGHG